jgi:hypothetical protein
MTTIPTTTADGNHTELLLKIELARLHLEIEKTKLKQREQRIGDREHVISGRAPGVLTASLQANTPVVVPVAGKHNATNDIPEAKEIIVKSQTFEQWLEQVRDTREYTGTSAAVKLTRISVALVQDKRAKRTLYAIGKSGRYNAETKTIHGSWVVAFREGIEKFSGKGYVVTEEDKRYVERLRRKCTLTPAWNYERVYRMACKGNDLLKLFQQPVEPMTRNMSEDVVGNTVHSQFPLAAHVRLIGRRRNISPLAEDDDNLYYIAKGSVFCSGVRDRCVCPEGSIRVMVAEIFPHDGTLQRLGGQCDEQISTQVLEIDSPLAWHQSLVRLMPKENIRKKPKPSKKSSKKGGKDNEVRKRKGGAIEASKPVRSVVERPGKRRTTKLALN